MIKVRDNEELQISAKEEAMFWNFHFDVREDAEGDISCWKNDEDHYQEIFDWLPWGQKGWYTLVKAATAKILAMIEDLSHWASQLCGMPGSLYPDTGYPMGVLLQLGEPEYILFDAIIDDLTCGKVIEITNGAPEVQRDQPRAAQENKDPFTFESNMAYDSYRPSPNNPQRYQMRSPLSPPCGNQRCPERSPVPLDQTRD